jgi:hypothetical protein
MLLNSQASLTLPRATRLRTGFLGGRLPINVPVSSLSKTVLAFLGTCAWSFSENSASIFLGHQEVAYCGRRLGNQVAN